VACPNIDISKIPTTTKIQEKFCTFFFFENLENILDSNS